MLFKFNLKNIAAYALVAILLASCIATTPAYAADNINIKVGTATTSDDGTYSIPVSIENNTGVAGVVFKVNYDTAVLKLVRVEASKEIFTTGIINTATAGSVTYVYAEANNNSSNGTLFTLKFQSVSASATSTEITITNVDLCDTDLKTINGQASNSTINVTAGSDSGNTPSGDESSTAGSQNNSSETTAGGSANMAESAGSNSNGSNNITTADGNTSNNNNNNAEAATEAGAPGENTEDDGNNNGITTWIIIGGIIVMCGICAAMGIMWYKKK